MKNSTQLKSGLLYGLILVTLGISAYEMGWHRGVNHEALSQKRISETLIRQQIDDVLLTVEAQRRGIPITDEEMNRAVEVVRARFPSQTEFENELKNEGINQKTFRARVRTQLMATKMIDQELAKPNPHGLSRNQRFEAFLETLRPPGSRQGR